MPYYMPPSAVPIVISSTKSHKTHRKAAKQKREHFIEDVKCYVLESEENREKCLDEVHRKLREEGRE